MRKRMLQVLLFSAIAVAIGWLILSPSPEPLIAVISGVVGLVSLESLDQKKRQPNSPASRKLPQSKLAVLPLRDIAETPGKEYFAAGLTEELISVLSRVGGLSIISNASSSQYRGESLSYGQIREDLDVTAVLQGSVRSASSELRVSLRLVDTESEELLWSEDYDRKLEEIFSVQREIAESVARALQITIHGNEAKLIAKPPTTDLQAYDMFLLGRHALNLRTEEGVLRSIELFESATKKDPSFAAAYAGIADAYVLSTIGYAKIPQDVAIDKARTAANKAVECQETLSDAHTSRGYVLINFDWNWNEAKAAFERAIELNPSNPRAHQWYGQCLLFARRYEEGIPLVLRAQELDPLSALVATEAGWPFLYLGRTDEAMVQFERALELDPNFFLAHFNIGNLMEATGDFEGALKKYRLASDLSGNIPMVTAFEARALALLGRKKDAEKLLKTVIAAHDTGAPVATYVAHVLEALGELDEALAWLERGVDAKEPMLFAINTKWMPFTRLEGQDRFQKITTKVWAEN